MQPQTLTRIVRITSLADFQREVPSDLGERKPIVRLIEYRREGEQLAKLILSLQGVNADDEIVWLCETHTVSWLFSKPFGPTAESIAEAMSTLTSMVKNWLVSQGYDVRSGDYGLPESIKPLAAHFECARWVKNGERCCVEAVSVG